MVSGPPHTHLGGWGWDGRPANKMRAMEVPIHSPPPGSPPKVAVIPKRRGLLRGFLGLRMVSAFEINEGRALHTFFEMDDGSCLAFFEVPGSPFDFKRQDSLDLHIALGVEPETFDAMLEKAKAEGREVRGPVDHRFVRSIYFRDPNGYVIELTASTGKHGEIMDPAISKPHEALAHWQATKSH
jgi:catechol 2,3-dioxygenase-like lactoylglutathione lyase family enzyme